MLFLLPVCVHVVDGAINCFVDFCFHQQSRVGVVQRVGRQQTTLPSHLTTRLLCCRWRQATLIRHSFLLTTHPSQHYPESKLPRYILDTAR
jgi:hypothetical protein